MYAEQGLIPARSLTYAGHVPVGMEELVLVLGQTDLLLLARPHAHPAGGTWPQTVAREQQAQHQQQQHHHHHQQPQRQWVAALHAWALALALALPLALAQGGVRQSGSRAVWQGGSRRQVAGGKWRRHAVSLVSLSLSCCWRALSSV